MKGSNMKWLKRIIEYLYNKTSGDIAEYRRNVEKEVQQHWKDHQIRLMELICDCWREPPTDSHALLDKYNYVVFIDIEGDLDWICNDDYSRSKVPSEVFTLIAKIMDVEALPCKHLGKNEWMAFKRMLGTAIVSAFESGHDEAESLMAQAKAYIEQRIPERSRLWTLWGATIGMILCCLAFYFLRNNVLVAPFVFGVFGAYVSIVRHASRRNVDSNAGIMLHLTETTVRLLIGAILGKMGVLFCNSSLAPEFARSFCVSVAGVRVIAFASGLFDAFIPAMISTYIISPLKSKGESHD